MERRLAAIMAADVVGYSGLMERDETGTLEALKAHRAEDVEEGAGPKGNSRQAAAVRTQRADVSCDPPRTIWYKSK